ncbi:unnamed protein product, partial [Brenthis ino]
MSRGSVRWGGWCTEGARGSGGREVAPGAWGVRAPPPGARPLRRLAPVCAAPRSRPHVSPLARRHSPVTAHSRLTSCHHTACLVLLDLAYRSGGSHLTGQH